MSLIPVAENLGQVENMKLCILRKVAYRLSASNRLACAIVLAERQGLSLLFVRWLDEKRSHTMAIALENVKERFS